MERVMEGATFFACRQEAVLQARLTLNEFSQSHSLGELLRKTLDEAERLTGSRIGFFHFLAADQRTIQRQMWSTNTLQRMCTAEKPECHTDIEEAGVWIDCIRHGRAVIHNDYTTLQHRKGLPTGHAPVVRETVVPVIRGDRIVAILGVGNKDEDYSSDDVETVSLLADLAWDITERKRSEEALKDSLQRTRASEERMSLVLSSVSDGLIALDDEGRITLMNPAAERLLGIRAGAGVGCPAAEVIRNAELLYCCTNLLADSAEAGPHELVIFDEQRRENRSIQVRLNILPQSDGRLGGVIAVLLDVTRVGVEAGDAEAVFYVRDNGAGIDSSFHEKIFGLFERLDPQSEGTGLGLAIVKRVVEMNGGRIWVESTGSGQGSCFRFTLPSATGARPGQRRRKDGP